MAIRIEQCYFDWNKSMDQHGLLTNAEIPYIVFGVEDEISALEEVYKFSDEKIRNLRRNTVEIDERLAQDVFKVRVSYEPDEFSIDENDQEPEPSFSFDTGGGSKHINQSLNTVSKTPSDAPDFNCCHLVHTCQSAILIQQGSHHGDPAGGYDIFPALSYFKPLCHHFTCRVELVCIVKHIHNILQLNNLFFYPVVNSSIYFTDSGVIIRTLE